LIDTQLAMDIPPDGSNIEQIIFRLEGVKS